MAFLTDHRFWVLGVVGLLAGAALPRATTSPCASCGLYVVLGKVLAARSHDETPRRPPFRRRMRYTYDVRVLASVAVRLRLRGRLLDYTCGYPMSPCTMKTDSTATIVGLRVFRRSWSVFTPIMKPGVYFVMMAGRQPDGSLSHTYADDGLMPIGIELPSPVAGGDVAKLQAAMLLYARLGGSLASAEAAKLRRSKNYYLWAWGSWALAKHATRGQVRYWLAILGRYRSPGFPAGPAKLSPRRAFWLVRCMKSVVPTAARPSCRELSTALAGYLRRLATPHVPGYKP